MNYDQGLIPGRRHGCLSVSLQPSSSESLRVSDFNRLSSEAKDKQREDTNMDSNSAGSVQHDRWNEDNINMNVEAPQSAVMRIYNRVCNGSYGVVVKTAGALAALVSIYIIGYVTGYYVHRC